eukprot:6214648-Pleurochrysis_carterae.AAC.4
MLTVQPFIACPKFPRTGEAQNGQTSDALEERPIWTSARLSTALSSVAPPSPLANETVTVPVSTHPNALLAIHSNSLLRPEVSCNQSVALLFGDARALLLTAYEYLRAQPE